MNVLYMCDNNFAQMAGVSITSLFENNPKSEVSITVFLLTVQVSEENHRFFGELARKYDQTICLIRAENAFAEIQQMKIATYRGSAMTNLRLCFDKLIPKTVERILYIDCDTIICDTLMELFHMDMEGKLLGMVLDAYGRIMSPVRYRSFLYYNAGIMLIDCDRWRKESWHGKIVDYVEHTGDRLSHPDQDIYNVVCRHEIKRLPIRYNFQTVHRMYDDNIYFKHMRQKGYYSEKEIAEARKNPGIIHMIRTLGNNPWNSGSDHVDCALYLFYKEISLWKDSPSIPVQYDTVIRIERLLYKLLTPGMFFPIMLAAVKTALRIEKENRY